MGMKILFCGVNATNDGAKKIVMDSVFFGRFHTAQNGEALTEGKFALIILCIADQHRIFRKHLRRKSLHLAEYLLRLSNKLDIRRFACFKLTRIVYFCCQE
jgi:hypothetical protein